MTQGARNKISARNEGITSSEVRKRPVTKATLWVMLNKKEMKWPKMLGWNSIERKFGSGFMLALLLLIP